MLSSVSALTALSCSEVSSNICSRGVGADLVGGLCAHDHRGHCGSREQPRERDLLHPQPPLAGEPVQLAGHADLGFGVAGATVAFASCDLAVQHSEVSQEAAVKRGVWHDREAEPYARGGKFPLWAAVQEAVHHLRGDRC